VPVFLFGKANGYNRGAKIHAGLMMVINALILKSLYV